MPARGSIVYVHGAGDRATNVDDHVARIERQLAAAGLAFDVLPSRWGQQAGADLSRVEDALPAVLPPAHVARAFAAPIDPQLALDRVRRLAEADAPPVGVPNGSRQADELLEICRTRVGAPGESIELRDGGAMQLAVACRLAANSVAASAEYVTARSSPVAEGMLVDAVGEAVVSTVAAISAAPAEVARTVEVRIAEAVMGAAVATILAGYLGIDVGPDLKRWATDVLLPHRARLLREAGLGPADIVLYQRNGTAIRAAVRTSLAEAIDRGRPVVALGNSLGGIILVDALAAPNAPRPDLLVTVGSQAPLLATFGALDPLGLPDAPPPFQPWLNIYDRRDLLGFVAARVWPAATGITDVEVDLGVGFPDSHGARYLSSTAVFDAISKHPALSHGGGHEPSGQRFTIASQGISAPLRAVLAVDAGSSYAQLAGELQVRFGRFSLHTPLDNVAGVRVSPASRGRTLLGFAGGLLRGVAALGARPSLAATVELRQPARWLVFPIRALELAVDEPTTFAEAVAGERPG